MKSKDKDLDIIQDFKSVACKIAEEIHNRTGMVYKENSICEYQRLVYLCNKLEYPEGHYYCYGMSFKYYKKDKNKDRVFVVRIYLIDKDTYLIMGTGLEEPEVFVGSVEDLIDRLTNGLMRKVDKMFKSTLADAISDKIASSNASHIDISDAELLKATDVELDDGFVRGNGKTYIKRNYGDFWHLLNRISGNSLRLDIKLWYFDDNHVKCPDISQEPIENKMFISKVYEHIIKAYSLNSLEATEVSEDKLTLSNGATIELDRKNDCSVIRDLKRYFILKKDTIHIGNEIAKYIDYYYYLRSSNGRNLLKYFKYMFGRLNEIDSNSKVSLLDCDISRLNKNSVTWVFRVSLTRNNKDITEIIRVTTNNNIVLAQFGDSELKDAYEVTDAFYSKCLGDSKQNEYSDFPDNMRIIIDEFKHRFMGEISSYRYLKIKKWSGFEYLAILSIGNRHIHISSVDSYSSFRVGYLIGSSKITEYQIKKNTDKLQCEIEKILDKIDGLVSEALKLG